jgi:hypothetical protein
MERPEVVVQRQLEAYNARDLARFLAEYSEDIEVFRLPAATPAIVGRKAFGEFYATQRFNHAGLPSRALIWSRQCKDCSRFLS